MNQTVMKRNHAILGKPQPWHPSHPSILLGAGQVFGTKNFKGYLYKSPVVALCERRKRVNIQEKWERSKTATTEKATFAEVFVGIVSTLWDQLSVAKVNQTQSELNKVKKFPKNP